MNEIALQLSVLATLEAVCLGLTITFVGAGIIWLARLYWRSNRNHLLIFISGLFIGFGFRGLIDQIVRLMS